MYVYLYTYYVCMYVCMHGSSSDLEIDGNLVKVTLKAPKELETQKGKSDKPPRDERTREAYRHRPEGRKVEPIRQRVADFGKPTTHSNDRKRYSPVSYSNQRDDRNKQLEVIHTYRIFIHTCIDLPIFI